MKIDNQKNIICKKIKIKGENKVNFILLAFLKLLEIGLNKLEKYK